MDFARRSPGLGQQQPLGLTPAAASSLYAAQLDLVADANASTWPLAHTSSFQPLQPTTIVLDLLPLACAASLLVFVGQFILYPAVRSFRARRRHAYQPISSSASSGTLVGVGDGSLAGTEVKGLGYVKRSGGLGVVAWAVLKLFALVVLEVLTVVAAVRTRGRKETIEAWALVATLGYAVVLSLLSLTVRPSVVSAKTRALKAHLATILLATWVIYFVRDIYPLATFTVAPQDKLDAILWVRLGLLTFAAVVAPLCSPRTHIPVSQPFGAYEPTAEQTASLLALYSYAYLDPLFRQAWALPSLAFEQLPPLADSDQAAFLRSSVLFELDPASTDPHAPANRKRHLGWRLLKAFRWRFVQGVVLALLFTAAQFLGPWGTNRLLKYLETNGEGTSVRPWFWITLIGGGPFLQATFLNTFSYRVSRLFIHLEAAVTLTLLDHTLRIQPRDGAAKEGTADKSQGKGVSGRLQNHISGDLASIISAQAVLMDGIVGPFGVVACAYALWKLLGPTSILSMALMILQLPVPAKLASISLGVQRALSKATDDRVQRIVEAISALRVTKAFGLENNVKQQVQELRIKEMAINRRKKILNLGLSIISQTLPLVTLLISLVVYAVVQKGPLTAAIIFSTTAIFDIFSRALHRLVNLTSLIESWVALARVNTFLQETELIDRYEEATPSAVSDDPSYVGFHNATFAWLKDAPADSDARNFKLQFDGDLRFHVGKINLVAGPTGAGKTSLLMALLGEMHFEPQAGADSSFGLPRTGGVAYASQQSWLQNLTLRDNILFGAPFNEERYAQVVEQCALERDFTLFDAGDQTEVGEKGLTLSGGQKARVTLARAIYSRADVLLLDDILSALDVHTSKFIVDHLLQGDLVKDRTVILVTHHVGLASQVADYLVTLDDGRVKSQGSISELKRVDSTLFKEPEGEEPDDVVAAEVEAVEGPVDAEVEKKSDGKLVLAEEKAEGRMSKRSLMLLLSALGGPWFWLCVGTGLVIDCAGITLQTAWLAVWARAYDDGGPVDTTYYLGVYAGLLTMAMTAYAIGAACWYLGTIRAGVVLHQKLLDSVFASTYRWQDLTPTGRITGRFTSAFSTIDGQVVGTTYALMEMVVSLATALVAITAVAPVFGLAGLVIGAVGGGIAQVYIHLNLSVKRLANNHKSPLFTFFNDTIVGLVSVRSYDAEAATRQEADRRCDNYMRANILTFNTNRWSNLRLDFLACIFSTLVSIYLIYGPSRRDASTIGFTLSVTVSFSSMILWLFRMLNQWEASATSLERVCDYLDCEQERAPTPAGVPPAYWPASGAIRIEGLVARYSVDGPVVLKGIDVNVKSGERVGVVGRTGSGKSTLALALLRLIPTEGKVFINDRDTSTVNLDALRSKLTIVPQDPTLFSGTLRNNIDPYDEHDDAALIEVLKSSGLSGEATSDDGTSTPHHLTLTSEISAGGENLSQGQRQLVSLARGLVRRSKIFLLDEATASVDFATDALIQQSIRNDLQGVTLITIAHRLRTIMDYDKILCLDAGKVIEFDTPANLLKAGGQFAEMVASSPDADELRELANRTQ